MKKHLLMTAALTAGLLFFNAPPARAFSPFGLMAALASDKDAEDMSGNPDDATQAGAAAHDDGIANESEESAHAGASAKATSAAERETAAQAKYAAAREPAGR